ncbi:MAG: glycine--tRNA ligase [Candidatus Paceibacterota bacterium]
MNHKSESNDTLEKVASLCKRRGFIYQGSEIYGGMSGTWDYAHLGLALKNNIKKLWWKRFVTDRDDMYGTDAAILMNQNVWKASGHVGGFSDPLVECKKCKRRFRADQLENDSSSCPDCGGELSEPKQFNMMFKTHVGVDENESSVSYLRPETAQGMFVNFKNVVDSFHPKLPFGMAQIGKAFRNEIAPRDFTFRSREFEQMEIEYFVEPSKWEESFEHFRKEMWNYIDDVGIDRSKVHELEVSGDSLAHYSKRTIDFEFDYPFGLKELYGLAYRTDFDLKSHTNASGVDLSFLNEETKERFIPHCIEPSLGVDRTVLVVLLDAYCEDEIGGEKRVFLKLSPNVAPVKVAVFPLLKNKPELVEKAREVFGMIRKEIPEAMFDDNGNIGKRYRRQDEIGTPFCVTVDFQTLEDNTVTLRDRDTAKQERVNISELVGKMK